VHTVQPAFHEATPPSGRLVVDLAEVEYVSSSGISLMISKARSLGASGGKLALCRLRPLVRQVFTMTRIDTILPIAATREEALDLLRQLVP